MQSSPILEDLFGLLPSITDHHAPQAAMHQLLKKTAHKEARELFSDAEKDNHTCIVIPIDASNYFQIYIYIFFGSYIYL